jgi:hypothetical protein
VEEVRGLEFDHVILPDADAATYRRSLPPGAPSTWPRPAPATSLVLAGVGPVSPWLAALAQGGGCAPR